MPPPLALFFCIVFVLFLLRLERKQATQVSWAQWIPTIWMLLIASKPLGVWFPSSVGGGAESGSPLDRYFHSGFLCLGLFILARRQFDWSSAIKKNTWLFLLIGFMLISILWSDIPYISFKRWIRQLVGIVMAFVVLSEREPRQALESIFRRTIYILIPFSIMLIKYYPYYGVMFGRWSGALMWVGVTTQKNGLGCLCLFAAFFLIWTLIRRWRGRDIPVTRYQTKVEVFVLLLALWMLKGPEGAYSATSIAALTVGLSTFFALLWMKKRRINIEANALSAIIILIIGFGIGAPISGGLFVGEGVTSILGRDATLTGRTDVWADLVSVAMQQPIVGHGFGGFWTPRSREVYKISGAHNGYLEVLIELGFVGLLFFSMFLLSSCRKAQRMLIYDFDWASLWICFLLIAVLHNITESSINSLTSHLTAVLMFLLVSSTATVSNNQMLPREV